MILILSLAYYKNIKINLKLKRSKHTDDKEKDSLISCNIKLGIISMIKHRRPNYKYLDEAYNILSESAVKMITYNNIRKFIEYKNLADWIYNQKLNIMFKKHKKENLDTVVLIIPMFNYHIQIFSKISFLEKGNTFFFRELIWKTQKYEEFAKFLEGYNRKIFYDRSCYNFPGYYYLVYNLNIIFKS